LAESFPDARLHLEPLESFVACMTNTLEGAWFTLCLVCALMLARR
jgi:hypothetical protein